MIATIARAFVWFSLAGLLLGQAAIITWSVLGLPLTGAGIIATFIVAGLIGVAAAAWRGELAPSRWSGSSQSAMVVALFAVGIVPFAVLGGFGNSEATSLVPWIAGFGAQTVFIVALLPKRPRL